MKSTIGAMVVAAALEVGGDAALRRGLVRAAWPWLALGAIMLVGYGLVVNLNRSIAFGRLMGLYIAMFFMVSQAIGFVVFGERPSLGLVAGGTLIVIGGLVLLLSET